MIATYLTMQRAILGRLSPRLFVRLAGRFAGIVGEKAAGSLDTILKSMGAKRRCTWTFLSALLIGAARCQNRRCIKQPWLGQHFTSYIVGRKTASQQSADR